MGRWHLHPRAGMSLRITASGNRHRLHRTQRRIFDAFRESFLHGFFDLCRILLELGIWIDCQCQRTVAIFGRRRRLGCWNRQNILSGNRPLLPGLCLPLSGLPVRWRTLCRKNRRELPYRLYPYTERRGVATHDWRPDIRSPIPAGRPGCGRNR